MNGSARRLFSLSLTLRQTQLVNSQLETMQIPVQWRNQSGILQLQYNVLAFSLERNNLAHEKGKSQLNRGFYDAFSCNVG